MSADAWKDVTVAMGATTPADRAGQAEREARDEVLQTMLDGNDTTLEYYGGEENERRFWADRNRHRVENESMLAAYRAAVRQATLAEVERVVENMTAAYSIRQVWSRAHNAPVVKFSYNHVDKTVMPEVLRRSDILAAVRGLGGTNG